MPLGLVAQSTLLLFIAGIVTLHVCNPYVLEMILMRVGMLPPQRVQFRPSVMDKPMQQEPIFWFAQISDIHVQNPEEFESNPRQQQLVRDKFAALQHAFFEFLPRVIRPSFVLVTGDLTHSKVRNNSEILDQLSWVEQKISLFRSVQCEKQWRMYEELQSRLNAKLGALWKDTARSSLVWQDGTPLDRYVIDIRGNHDSFNSDPRFNSHFYEQYSSIGSRLEKDQKVFNFEYKTDFGSYGFIGLDSTYMPHPESGETGLFSPLNFFGRLSGADLHRFETKILESNAHNNHTVAFGHYPLSVIASYDRSQRSGSLMLGLSRHVPFAAYLSGHLHTITSLLPINDLKARAWGHLELEVGDFAVTRRVRILAFDHDVLSFVEPSTADETVLLVTNPKDSRYLSSLEPAHPRKTQIRMLVFMSRVPQELTARAFVNGKLVAERLVQGKLLQQTPPLIALDWDPTPYLTGTHNLRVEVSYIDESTGQEKIKVHSHDFSLDGTLGQLPIISALILLTDWSYFFPMSYYLIIAYMLLLIYRAHRRKLLDHLDWRLRAVFLAHIVWMAFGPLFVGELADGHHGIVFPLRIFVFRTRNEPYPKLLKPMDVACEVVMQVGLGMLSMLVPTLLYLAFVQRPSIIRRFLRNKWILFIANASIILLLQFRMRKFYMLWIVRRYGWLAMVSAIPGLFFPALYIISLAKRSYRQFRYLESEVKFESEKDKSH